MDNINISKLLWKDPLVSQFIENCEIDLPRKLIYNGIWKKTENELAVVMKRILDTLNDS
ncbi:hypothetical protein C1645_823917 [Glomus cerebriforme]|uniref:Uncharacterized protein n=1 Tax=Glomus cerebriforme TaxID=658196 RepID=A0A397T4J7_9GLOM|nr:hypothetical protein C1645_823917 [Glomus cerebriforme]